MCDRRASKYGYAYNSAKKYNYTGEIISGRKYIPHSQSLLNIFVRMYIPHSHSKENVSVHRYIKHNLVMNMNLVIILMMMFMLMLNH